VPTPTPSESPSSVEAWWQAVGFAPEKPHTEEIPEAYDAIHLEGMPPEISLWHATDAQGNDLYRLYGRIGGKQVAFYPADADGIVQPDALPIIMTNELAALSGESSVSDVPALPVSGLAIDAHPLINSGTAEDHSTTAGASTAPASIPATATAIEAATATEHSPLSLTPVSTPGATPSVPAPTGSVQDPVTGQDNTNDGGKPSWHIPATVVVLVLLLILLINRRKRK
jgi:hypothetical protein